MASFCRQCSEMIFGEDYGDLKGCTPAEAWAAGMACWVICEGCGHIQVDPEGRCCGGCMEGHPRRTPEPPRAN